MLAFLFKVWDLARPYRARLFMGVIAGVIGGLVAPLMIATAAFVYGAVFPSPGKNGAAQLPIKHLPAFAQTWFENIQSALTNGVKTHPWAVVAMVLAVPLVAFLRSLFSYLNVYFLQWTASRAVADLRTRLFAHLLNLSAGFYSENATGLLISRVMNDTAALQSILSGATSVIVRDPVTIIVTMAYLFSQNWKLTLIAMIALPAGMIPIAIYTRKIRRASREMQTQFAELTQIMTETFTGHRVIKAYNLENITAGNFREAARKSVGNYMRIVRANEIPSGLVEFFGACGIALLLAYLIYFSQTRPNPVVFVQLIFSIVLLYQPLKNLTRLQNQIVQARAASERAFELLATRNSVPEPAQPKILKVAGAEIQFDRVSFSYGEKVALHEINLQIKPGQLVALVGSSGSGKTTLSNLLLRFYDPASGAIRIGGTDIREFSTRDLRSQIAVVTQETVLFNDTIRQNIGLGRIGATNEEIIAAAQHAHSHQFILEKLNGYETVIGEKGVVLSGGQRQRLAIARAVLRNAPILILDEATNALDSESERAVQTALDELMRGRTTLCIAHRLSTILHADLIVVLDQGRIIETGRHDELLKRGGVYQKLYELQFQSRTNG